jgi:hypothetical protein
MYKALKMEIKTHHGKATGDLHVSIPAHVCTQYHSIYAQDNSEAKVDSVG